MRYLLLFMIAYCIALGSLTAQQNYFIAGDTADVLYYDIQPDIRLSTSYNDTYNIDIDRNGTDDFIIVTYYNGYWNEFIEYVRVGSYGSNMVGYSHNSVHFGETGIGLGFGDTINDDISFIANILKKDN